VSANEFNLNNAPTFSCAFAVSGTATDPTTVSLLVEKPDKTQTTYTYAGGTITKGSTGNYSKQVTLDAVGIWRFVWTGTGACSASDSGTITVTG
jgi:hypothetical protein